MPQENSNSAKWFIVVIGFVVLSLTFSTRSTLGLVMPLWRSEFGWSQTFISSGGAIALIVMAVVAPFAGRFVDKYGARSVIIGGMGLVTLAMVLLSQIGSQWSFLFAFSGIAGVGFGITAIHVIATAVAPLFKRRQGLAIGIATAGASAGQLLVIPLFAIALSYVGWRNGYIMLAFSGLLVLLLALFFMPRYHAGETKVEESKSAAPPLGP